MKRNIFNFCAGPCVLPRKVIQTCKDQMLDYKGSGMSVLELSHRENEFKTITSDMQRDLRQFLSIPDNFHILNFQGGAV